MTPAIEYAKSKGVVFKVHEFDHDPSAPSFGKEAAEKLGFEEEQVFKTLIVSLNGDRKEMAVGIVPVCYQLDLKRMANAVMARKAAMAEVKDAERTTGYIHGGISPIAQRKQLPTVLDETAILFDTIIISAGRRGLQIEIAPDDLVVLCNGKMEAIAKES